MSGFCSAVQQKAAFAGLAAKHQSTQKRTCHVLQSVSCPQKVSVHTNYNEATATMYDRSVHMLFDFNYGVRI